MVRVPKRTTLSEHSGDLTLYPFLKPELSDHSLTFLASSAAVPLGCDAKVVAAQPHPGMAPFQVGKTESIAALTLWGMLRSITWLITM